MAQPRARTILLTGFEPFGDAATNPSGSAVRLVEQQWVEPERLVTAVLPVTFGGAADALRALIRRHRPDVVLATGLAAGRTGISVERVAVNLRDAPIPDNAGAQPVDVACVPGAPDALFATVPVKAMAAAVRAAGLPASVSLSAGSYVCNDVMFAAVHASESAARAGFVHVPTDGTLAGDLPRMDLEDIARAVRIAAIVALRDDEDRSAPAGAVH